MVDLPQNYTSPAGPRLGASSIGKRTLIRSEGSPRVQVTEHRLQMRFGPLLREEGQPPFRGVGIFRIVNVALLVKGAVGRKEMT